MEARELNWYVDRISAADKVGRLFRSASWTLSSGVRVPSIWRWSSNLGRPWMNSSIDLAAIIGASESTLWRGNWGVDSTLVVEGIAVMISACGLIADLGCGGS